MKVHNYGKVREIQAELYNAAQEYRHIDDNRCVASDVADFLDKIRCQLDKYCDADNEVEVDN